MRARKSVILFAFTAAVLTAAYYAARDTDFAPVPEPWKKIRRGMTKQEILAVVGEPRTKSGPSRITFLGLVITRKEFWQYYGGSWSPLLGPSDGAYVVYFSSDDKVASLRKPKRKCTD